MSVPFTQLTDVSKLLAADDNSDEIMLNGLMFASLMKAYFIFNLHLNDRRLRVFCRFGGNVLTLL